MSAVGRTSLVVVVFMTAFRDSLQAYVDSDGHSVKFQAAYRPPYQVYRDWHPDVGAAAQFVQYASNTGGKYKGSPYGNPRFQGSYDTSKRYYALLSVSFPILAMISIISFLPNVANFGGRKRRSLEDGLTMREKQDAILKLLNKAIDAWTEAMNEPLES